MTVCFTKYCTPNLILFKLYIPKVLIKMKTKENDRVHWFFGWFYLKLRDYTVLQCCVLRVSTLELDS